MLSFERKINFLLSNVLNSYAIALYLRSASTVSHCLWFEPWASEGFFPGPVGDFPKNFSRGGPKVVKFGFYPSKLKKQPFFANNFKIQGGPATPSDVHGWNVVVSSGRLQEIAVSYSYFKQGV